MISISTLGYLTCRARRRANRPIRECSAEIKGGNYTKDEQQASNTRNGTSKNTKKKKKKKKTKTEYRIPQQQNCQLLLRASVRNRNHQVPNFEGAVHCWGIRRAATLALKPSASKPRAVELPVDPELPNACSER